MAGDPPNQTPDDASRRPPTSPLRIGLAALALVVGACGPGEDPPPAIDAQEAMATAEAAFAECLAGEADAGIATLDTLLAQSSAFADALVARGLCHWARWDETADEADARQAYEDLSAAIEAVEGDRDGAQSTPLDQMYSHRAFIARALDDDWARTIEDLDEAVGLAPRNPTHVLDRGVVRSYAGDTTGARADLQRFLVIADSADVERQRVVESMLETLAPTAE